MKKETKTLAKILGPVMLAISGCQTLDRKPEYKFGECQMSTRAYRYLVNEVGAEKMLDSEENEHFCRLFAERTNYLTLRKVKKGLQALAAGSPHQ